MSGNRHPIGWTQKHAEKGIRSGRSRRRRCAWEGGRPGARRTPRRQGAPRGTDFERHDHLPLGAREFRKGRAWLDLDVEPRTDARPERGCIGAREARIDLVDDEHRVSRPGTSLSSEVVRSRSCSNRRRFTDGVTRATPADSRRRPPPVGRPTACSRSTLVCRSPPCD